MYNRITTEKRSLSMKTNAIQKVKQIGVPVKELNRAIDFYKGKLGLTLLFNTDTMAFFELNGLTVMLTLPEKEDFAHPSSVLYFQVENIQETYKELLEIDVSFIDQPHMVAKIGDTETWMTFFKDTEDNIHALLSEVQA